MSLYNLLSGRGASGNALVAVLGIEDVGRYRDAWIERGDDGKLRIAVYTRNGGGNRECWHADDPEWGDEACEHEAFEAEEDERERYVVNDNNPAQGVHLMGAGPNGETMSERETGRKVMVTRYRCLKPGTSACACVGCTQEYRLPAHPLYLFDQDDDFDCTYCTNYFSLPAEFEAAVEAAAGDDVGGARNMSEWWQTAIDALAAAHAPETGGAE